MTKTYSNKSNAIRGFRSANPDLAELDNATVGPFVRIHTGTSEQDPSGLYVDVDALRASLAPVVTEEAAPVDADGLRPIKGTGAYKDVPLLRRSDEGGAVSAAWGVFDELYEADPKTTRKAMIAEAVDQGIAFYTARTQYQKWLHRNDPKPEGE